MQTVAKICRFSHFIFYMFLIVKYLQINKLYLFSLCFLKARRRLTSFRNCSFKNGGKYEIPIQRTGIKNLFEIAV